MPRLGAIWTIFLVIGAALMVAPAAAHSPYFTTTEKIALPDGTTGEIRLLHGDGILRSDPVRAVVIDAEGRALARSPQSYAMTIRCDGPKRCKAYDLDRFTVSTPDPASFRPGGSLSDVNERGMLVDGSGKPWGFTTKRMSFGDLVVGHAVYLRNNIYPTVIPLLLTGFAAMFVLGVLRPAPSRRLYDRIVWSAIIVAAFAIAGFLILMNLLMLIVTGLPEQLWFLLSASAAAAVGFLFWWRRRRRAQPA
jgi:hypothetical protein